jgi:lipopolysaccharide/colanic/teichoic acid biosynthesis glycosyltransferase
MNSRGKDGFARRLVHGGLALLLLALLAPVMLVVALLVRLSSPGPVFFRQQRVGRGGRLFWIYKFRTMRVNSSGPQITGGSDPRITPIGAMLRRWKLDEIPQLLNVVKGEMAFVGPRPEVPRYVAHYTPEQQEVLKVLPGITGAAQVCFRHEEDLLRDAQDPEALYLREILPAKLALDLQYVRKRGAWTDLCLTVQTLRELLPGRGH